MLYVFLNSSSFSFFLFFFFKRVIFQREHFFFSFLFSKGPNENLDFNEFGNHLDEIEKSNTKINITSSTVFKWFDIFSVIENYFAYPGDYGGCSCATSIVCIARYNRPYISERQVSLFKNK